MKYNIPRIKYYYMDELIGWRCENSRTGFCVKKGYEKEFGRAFGTFGGVSYYALKMASRRPNN